MVKALVLMAEGFEEIEISNIVDILRRGGVSVTVAGLQDGLIKGAHGMKMQPDTALDSVKEEHDIIILPGGYPGFVNLGKDQRVLGLVKKYEGSGKNVAAICGAPSVLAKAGILSGKKATIYKGMEGELKDAQVTDQAVVEDGKLITSQGPGTAMEFALKVLEKLTNAKKATEIKQQLLFKG